MQQKIPGPRTNRFGKSMCVQFLFIVVEQCKLETQSGKQWLTHTHKLIHHLKKKKGTDEKISFMLDTFLKVLELNPVV